MDDAAVVWTVWCVDRVASGVSEGALEESIIASIMK